MWKGNSYISYLEIGDALSQNHSTAVAFDIDWTLIRPKNNKYPRSVVDWKYLYDNVRDELRLLSDKHTIVGFSNQTLLNKPERRAMILERFKKFAEDLGVPIVLYVSMDNTVFRKPNLGMIDLFREQTSGFCDIKFYVGDAAGRDGDFSDSDLRFAINMDVKFYTPEQYFLGNDDYTPKTIGYIPTIPNGCEFNSEVLSTELHAVILVGYPGTGKTIFAKTILSDHYYVEYKARNKMMMPVNADGIFNQSVVIDGNHLSPIQRKRSLKFIPGGVPVYVIYFKMPYEEALHRNNYYINRAFYDDSRPILSRDVVSKLSTAAYGAVKKCFVEPTMYEGFVDIIVYKPNIEDTLYYRL